MADTNDARHIATGPDLEWQAKMFHLEMDKLGIPRDDGEDFYSILGRALLAISTPQDATPRAAVPLTYLTVEQIDALWGDFMSAKGSGYVPDFVRSVEAKFCEVNGITTASPAPSAAPESEAVDAARWRVVEKAANDMKTSRFNTLVWLLGLSEGEDCEEAMTDADLRFNLGKRIDAAMASQKVGAT